MTHILSTTFDFGSLYSYATKECPRCKDEGLSTAIPYLVGVYELIDQDVQEGKTISRYKVGDRCPQCGYEDTQITEITTWYSNSVDAEIRKFTDMVKEMRQCQNQYFKSRDQSSLIKSKEAERKVDNYIENLDNPTLWLNMEE